MKRILCIGSVNQDHTYQVSHIVGSGETLSCGDYQFHWGGKGLNQALALARAGAEVQLAGRVAREDLPALRALGEANGLDVSRLVGGELPTGRAVIQLDSAGENAILVCAGANGALTREDVCRALEGYGPGDLLLLQNEVNDVPGLIRAGRERGLTVALNPSPITPGMERWPLEQVDLLLFNEVEGKALTGREEPQEILEVLRRTYPQTALVLTLGAQGARFCRGMGPLLTQPAHPAQTVDTTAAGDTFTGYFLSALTRGMETAPALEMASRAAAIAVSRPGATDSIPTLEEVLSSQ